MSEFLLEYFEKNARGLNFFGAVSLLEEFYAEKGIPDPVGRGKIFFRPGGSISFPPSDIEEFRRFEDTCLFTLSFMGLCGVSSPLPVYFSEAIARNESAAGPLRDFLTIFNCRIYALFYQAWKKYYLLRTIGDVAADPLIRCIAALAGTKPGGQNSGTEIRILAYAGLLASSARGSGGLSALLSGFFGGVRVEVREFMPTWVPIGNPTTLGSIETAELGRTAMTGTSVYDRSGKFRVVIGPVDRLLFESFLENGENYPLLKKLIETYLADPLEYDLEIILQVTSLFPVQLGCGNVRLGETAMLGRSGSSLETRSQIVTGRSFK